MEGKYWKTSNQENIESKLRREVVVKPSCQISTNREMMCNEFGQVRTVTLHA